MPGTVCRVRNASDVLFANMSNFLGQDLFQLYNIVRNEAAQVVVATIFLINMLK